MKVVKGGDSENSHIYKQTGLTLKCMLISI